MSAVTIDLSLDSDDLEELPELNLATRKNKDQVVPSSSTTTDVESSSQSSGKSGQGRPGPKSKKAKKTTEEQVATQAQKIYKPGECMKHILIEMHPNLLEAWYCADVTREVTASGAKIKTNTALCDVRLVLWSRLVEPTLASKDGVVGLTPIKEPCNHGLYVTRLEDIEEHIKEQSLSQHMLSTAGFAGCKLTLVLFAVKEYFKVTGRKTLNSSKKIIQPVELEMALTDLLVTADCDTIKVETPNELALTFVQFTKALAEAPYKKSKRAYDEQAEYYMRGDNKKCVPISKNGDGVPALWQQMLAVLPQSSLETARAICKQYNSLKIMYKEQNKPNGLENLANTGVSRSAVPGSKERRVGHEFAKKLNVFFTAEDGDTLVE